MGRSQTKSSVSTTVAFVFLSGAHKTLTSCCCVFALFVAKRERRREAVYSTELKSVIVVSALFSQNYRELFPRTVLELCLITLIAGALTTIGINNYS